MIIRIERTFFTRADTSLSATLFAVVSLMNKAQTTLSGNRSETKEDKLQCQICQQRLDVQAFPWIRI